jgi:uncharacterized protein (DUF1800 family)
MPIAQSTAGLIRPAGMLDSHAALRPYAGPWNERLAAHLLRRAGFGGDAATVGRAASGSMHSSVDELLNYPSTSALPQPDELYDPRELIRQNLRNLGPEFFKMIRPQERRSVISLQNWWLNRMLMTPAPLQEKMTVYFHGHFTTAAIQKGVLPQMVYDQNELFRNNALGNLRELTWRVSIDPAMMLYLDNARNESQHPNENYARELMELFTMGVDQYTERDVREAARAWTGWVVVRRTSKSLFVPSRHDGGSKTFLAQTGNWDGRDIVDIIYRQPACARFWAGSLLNFFVYNNPEPQLVDALAHVIRKNDYELKPVISTLLRSNVFYSPRAYRALVKSPVEFVIGTYKALGIQQIDEPAQRALSQMGQILFYPPNVAGWPGGSNWLTSQTMIARENFLARVVNSPMMNGSTWLQTMPNNAASAASELVRTLLYGDASPGSVAQIQAYLNGTGASALGALSGENREERMRGAAYLTMAMPGYQLN